MAELWTVGHSTRTQAELVDLLEQNDVRTLVDVRRYPASRRHPQFNREALERSLPASGIDYVWMPDLGGRRAPRKGSPNTAWRNAGFRGYADYMETDAFRVGIESLLRHVQRQRTAVMCAEQAWQQCHRGLISDYLKAGGVEVTHIRGPGSIEPHPWTAAARIVNGKLSYAAGAKAGQQGWDF
jgi:uncharacterized protein (DUF488 family)